MSETKIPTCELKECFACEEGQCIVLTRNNFNKPCPFFKTREQVRKEREYCEKRNKERM